MYGHDDFNLYPWSYFLFVQKELRRIGRSDLADRINGFQDQVEDMERRVLAVEGLLDDLLDRLTVEEVDLFLAEPEQEHASCLQG